MNTRPHAYMIHRHLFIYAPHDISFNFKYLSASFPISYNLSGLYPSMFSLPVRRTVNAERENYTVTLRFMINFVEDSFIKYLCCIRHGAAVARSNKYKILIRKLCLSGST